MFHGLMFCCLLVFLTSCSSTKIEQVKITPPDAYLQPVTVEPCAKKTNEDLLKCYLKTKKALDRANDDKLKIRQWSES